MYHLIEMLSLSRLSWQGMSSCATLPQMSLGCPAIANAPPVRRLNEIGADKREIFWPTNCNQRGFTASVGNFSLGFPK